MLSITTTLYVPWIYTRGDALLLNLLVALLRILRSILHQWLRRREENGAQLPQKDQNLSHRALIIVQGLHNELPEILVVYGCGVL
jgi:hypothetical protein